MDENYRPPANTQDRIRAGLALQLVAASTGVPVERMTARTRLKNQACRGRWLAMYLTHTSFGWPIERVGLAFGLNRATATKACRWAEDERDRPLMDELLDRMDRCVRVLFEAPTCELPA